MSVLTRLAIAIVAASSISLLARRARSLSADGAAAAAVIGTLALFAGWKWAVLLIVYFASSTALSRLGADKKNARTQSIIEKGGERDARQVLANGAFFGLAAALAVLAPGHPNRWMALGVGALAESASDTWATEIGTLFGGKPRSFTTFAPLAAGMSGGVTIAGGVAALAGATFMATAAASMGWPMRVVVASFAGGVIGSTLDSFLGATLQLRRRCDRCDSATERMVHDCGAKTRPVSGIPWLGNDGVNLICGAAGGLLALAIVG